MRRAYTAAAMADITELLQRANQGDAAALDELMPLVYANLRQLAHRQLSRESHAHTLDTTALVHELYLGLHRGGELPGEARGQFFAYAATAMRHILVDAARRRASGKRGGGHQRMELDSLSLSAEGEVHDVLAVNQVLEQLQQVNPRLVRMIEMRFFAGMSVEDTASALEIDPRSVVRDWQKARLFLHRALAAG